MHDVVVIGGGPSGLNAASRLAKKGLKVLVLEKKKEIGDHVVCTGIVGREAFEKFNLMKDSVLKEIDRIKWISPMGSYLSYEHPSPFACVVDRKKFDMNLSSSAALNGAELKCENEVTDISIGKGHAEVIVKRKGEFTEKYATQMVILATGINYRLHKKLGLGYPKKFLEGAQAELDFNDQDCTHVFIGRNVAPGAFAWSVPIEEGRIRLGLMSERNSLVCFTRLIRMFYPKESERLSKNRVQFRAIAQGLVSPTYGERILTLGEAAGQVKTTTGGGIFYGLLCSEIAGDVIGQKFRTGDFSRTSLRDYEKRWRKAIKSEISVGLLARQLCAKLNDHQIERLFQIARTDGVIPLIREKGDFDWHKELVLALLKKIPVLEMLKAKLRGT